MKSYFSRMCAVVFVFAFSGCSGAELGTEATESSHHALDNCPLPELGAGDICDLGGGQVRYQVTLASNQAYVEVFSLQNGLQNIATNIVSSESSHGDGTSTYSYAAAGYVAGDSIEYRFYSYLQGSSEVFTPGPEEMKWYQYSYGQSSEVDEMTGAWSFASSDLTPSTSYAIDGDTIHLTFGGYYTWNGTWSSGYQGYTFERPVAVTHGATYRLSLAVSNTSNQIPVVLRASIAGAGAEQQRMIQGNGTIQMDFTVASDPGVAPVVTLTAHPVLGHVGPVEGTGIATQSYDVTPSLARIP